MGQCNIETSGEPSFNITKAISHGISKMGRVSKDNMGLALTLSLVHCNMNVGYGCVALGTGQGCLGFSSWGLLGINPVFIWFAGKASFKQCY